MEGGGKRHGNGQEVKGGGGGEAKGRVGVNEGVKKGRKTNTAQEEVETSKILITDWKSLEEEQKSTRLRALLFVVVIIAACRL